MSSGGSEAVTATASETMAGGQTIDGGGFLTVSGGGSLTIAAGDLLTDSGTLTISSGGVVTAAACCLSPRKAARLSTLVR